MSNTESTRALRNGLLDAAALTLDEALRLADEGVAVKIVALIDSSNGADAVMVRAGIDSLADLKGKRIALEKSALGALMLDRLLREAGLQHADVETVHVEASQHIEALTNGSVDCVITFEPMKSRLLARGFHSLFDSSRLPGEIVDTLVVQAAIEPSRVTYLLQAWENGLRQLQADPQKAADLLAPSIELSSQEYLAALRGVRFMSLAESTAKLDRSGAGLMHDANLLAGHLQQLGLLRHAPEWAALLDNRAAHLVLARP
jgi:NitT/TauT family transport system substrate-binding protein